jgi:hypothetical protein
VLPDQAFAIAAELREGRFRIVLGALANRCVHRRDGPSPVQEGEGHGPSLARDSGQPVSRIRASRRALSNPGELLELPFSHAGQPVLAERGRRADARVIGSMAVTQGMHVRSILIEPCA